MTRALFVIAWLLSAAATAVVIARVIHLRDKHG